MANGIGRVWAANAGDDEQRPNGVGSVWIENIDALAPSGGASEQQINDLSAAIDYVSANAGGESNVVTDNGEFTVLPNTLGDGVTVKYPTDVASYGEPSATPFHEGEWEEWAGNSGADPNNTDSQLGMILHLSDTTPINLDGEKIQVTLPHAISGVTGMNLYYLYPGASTPMAGPNASNSIGANNNTYSAGKYVFNCVGNPYSAQTGTYGCNLGLGFGRAASVYGPSSIDARFDTLEYGPATGYEVNLNRYVPSGDSYIGVGVNNATKQTVISATYNLTGQLNKINPTYYTVNSNSATWNSITNKLDTTAFNNAIASLLPYPIKYAATSAEATDYFTLYVLTGNSMGDIVPTLLFRAIDKYNPLGLPANTIRCKFTEGHTPTIGDTQTLVDATNNVWDIYKESNNWYLLFNGSRLSLLEVLGANTSNVTDMSNMFSDCSYITTVPLFDTSSVTNMERMFAGCSRLTNVPLFDTSNVINLNRVFTLCDSLMTIPLFDTSKATDMTRMFYQCSNVQSGALALYQQASTQTNPPASHSGTFNGCGTNTQTGAAELAQIPSNWK